MKGIIIYKSRYGSTKQYAEWLREDTGFDLCEAGQCPADLHGYEVVVIGSSVFAGHVAMAKWMTAHWPALRDKPVLLMMVNITPDPEERAKFVPQSLPAEIAERIEVFSVSGRYDIDRMGFLDRTMIKMVSSMEKRPEVKQEMLEKRDWVKHENLQEILARLREMGAAGK